MGNVELSKVKTGQFEVLRHRFYRLDGDVKNGYLRSFFIIVSYLFDFERNCTVQLSAILPGRFVNLNLPTPDTVPLPLAWSSLWQQIEREKYPGQMPERITPHTFYFIPAFQGVVVFDQGFRDSLDGGFSRIIARTLEVWQPLVKSQMQEQKEILLGAVSRSIQMHAERTIFIPSSLEDRF